MNDTRINVTTRIQWQTTGTGADPAHDLFLDHLTDEHTVKECATWEEAIALRDRILAITRRTMSDKDLSDMTGYEFMATLTKEAEATIRQDEVAKDWLSDSTPSDNRSLRSHILEKWEAAEASVGRLMKESDYWRAKAEGGKMVDGEWVEGWPI